MADFLVQINTVEAFITYSVAAGESKRVTGRSRIASLQASSAIKTATGASAIKTARGSSAINTLTGRSKIEE